MHDVILRIDKGQGFSETNPYISRRHAVFQYQNDYYTIIDLKSKHGIEINGLSL
ncbi:FHA domain-containing protein [Peribacillus loiseleuriae]|uniref:FHA domain-containing protein n=1 Tax=Peribacillus loiseleuriae TaxID=1679170 RepID=UPI000A3F19EB|nr:FHA domain-containing protein [Peribacillus loiseleuriae]